MKKKIFSLLAVLLVAATAFATFVIVKSNGTLITAVSDKLSFEQNGSSFTVNGIDVKDIAHIYNKDWDKYDEYERAFIQNYLDSKYYTYDRKKQITSQELKAMLKTIVEKLQPDSMSYFNSRISDADEPITRGIAVGMAYYTARCIGAVQSNLVNDHSDAPDFWNDIWVDNLQEILPSAQMPMAGDENGWQEMIHAVLWNDSHISYHSEKEVIAFDLESYLWHWGDAFTREEAVRAVTRLYDSFEPEAPVAVYVDVDDPSVTTADLSIITQELIAYAAQREIHNIDDLPRLYGFQTGETMAPYTKNFTKLDIKARDIEDFADWGFNTVRYILPYWALFNSDVQQANVTILKALDELIAAAMEKNIHLVFSLSDVPGRAQWLQDDPTLPYFLDCDIQSVEKRRQAQKVWTTLATRYKDVPNANLSFTPVEGIGVLLDPAGFGEGEKQAFEEVTAFVDLLIDAIRGVSPERFIFYDVFHGSGSFGHESNFAEDKTLHDHLATKYKNTRMIINQMDMAYGFYCYNDGDGNIDYASHSSWMPYYPIYQYAFNCGLGGEQNKLTFDGCLPKGTVIELYLRSTDGATLTVTADDGKLYEESFSGYQEYNVGYAACYGEQFRASDKKISVALDKEVKELVISSGAGWLFWSGINVILPESYAVERWRRDSQWDVQTGLLAPEDFHMEFYKKKTSTIQLGGYWFSEDNSATRITIHDDVTYTSDTVSQYSDAKLYDDFCKEFAKIDSRWSVRMEDINSTDFESSLRYFNDLAEVFQKYNVDVWTSATCNLMEQYPYYAPYHVAGYEGEQFGRHHNFNVKLLRVLQKYQDK